MPTVNILPNADVSNSPAWTLSTGSDVFALLDDDDTGAPSSDGSQITTTAAGKKCVVCFQDFTEAHSSIDSVQAVIRADIHARSQTYTIGMRILNNGSGSAAWSEETISDSSSVSWNTHTFTSRATSTSGGDDWDEDDFGTNALAMEIHAHTMSGDTLRVTYAYFIVTYTAAVADNAVFFGTNF